MGERGRRYADDLATLTDEVAAAIARSDAQWRLPCRDEGRTIGVVAFHIADGYRYALAVLDAAVSGQSYPAWVGRTPEEGEAINARQADEHADVSRDEVHALLVANARSVDAFLRSLTDEQLAAEPSFAPGRMVANGIETIVFGHIRSHLANVVASLDR